MPAHTIKKLILKLLPACQNPVLAEQEAWWLLEAVTHKSKFELLLIGHLDIGQDARALLDAMIEKRVHEHQPLQYILGTVPFCGLTIHVRPPILIPRPETEEWVSWLIESYKQAGITTFTALDLCTGSGCIGLALAKHFPHATVLGIDLNPEAIELANINKSANNLTNISFTTSNMFSNLPANSTYDLIVSNPPYLSPEEYQALDKEVLIWEDKNALVGEQDGMFFYHEILQRAPLFLRPTSPDKKTVPNIVMEIGPAQEIHLEQMLKTLHLAKYAIARDLQGKQRWISLTIST
jgi:release factor glutamine methyltransferase